MIVNPPFQTAQTSGSGGGGGNIPLLSQFTVHNNSGGSANDAAGGLHIFSPQVGHGNLGGMLLSQKAAYPVGNYTVTIGFTSDLSWTGIGGGASQICGAMVYFRDPIGGKIVGFGPSLRLFQVYPDSNLIYGQESNYGGGGIIPPGATSLASGLNPYPQFVSVNVVGGYSGGTFDVYYGQSANALTFASSVPQNDILQHAPAEVGLWVVDSDGGANGINATYYYYLVQ